VGGGCDGDWNRQWTELSGQEEGGADLGWDPPVIIMMERQLVDPLLCRGLGVVIKGESVNYLPGICREIFEFGQRSSGINIRFIYKFLTFLHSKCCACCGGSLDKSLPLKA